MKETSEHVTATIHGVRVTKRGCQKKREVIKTQPVHEGGEWKEHLRVKKKNGISEEKGKSTGKGSQRRGVSTSCRPIQALREMILDISHLNRKLGKTRVSSIRQFKPLQGASAE